MKLFNKVSIPHVGSDIESQVDGVTSDDKDQFGN